ncbi:MAG: HlyC/CorC family transporter [Armatimonadetes bacterium]|nr:HlyC/CorC family transporter [Armatimonadota bacterium]
MAETSGIYALISVLLILLNGFFVASEYALISARRTRLEALSRRGSKSAPGLLRALENITPLVAAAQVAITMLGIGIGSITEPYVTHLLVGILGQTPAHSLSYLLAFVIVTFLVVVVGELVPKYVVLRHADRSALITYRGLVATSTIFRPITWLAQATAGALLKPFGINIKEEEGDVLSKEEVLGMLQSGSAQGLEKDHAELVTRALRIDQLDAGDIMIHRLDVKWLDATWDRSKVIEKIKQIPFTRLPLCRGDIDDVVGIVYLHDIVKHWDDPDFSLEKIARSAVMVPENLPIGKIVAQMRDNKTQMLIVLDEYGGMSGLLTLEDVVEEVFGELQDSVESERPAIEVIASGRVSVRADLRYDELLAGLKIETQDPEVNTESLAQIIVESLGRTPRPGDSVDLPIGNARVENVTRRRITRIAITLNPPESPEEE